MVKKAEIQERVQAAYFLLLQGTQYKDIGRALSSQYQICERQAERYIEKAKQLILSPSFAIQENALLDLQRTEYLYSQSMTNQKLDMAIQLLLTRNKLRKEIIQYEHAAKFKAQSPDLPDTLAKALSSLEGTEKLASKDT